MGDLLAQLTCFQRLLDDDREFVQIERLVDVIVRSETHGLDSGFENAKSGDHDHDDLAVCLFDALQNLQAVHAGQLDIEQHQLRGVVLHLLEGLLTTGSGDHVVTLLEQGLLKRPANQMFVIDNQNSCITHDYPRSDPAQRSG